MPSPGRVTRSATFRTRRGGGVRGPAGRHGGRARRLGGAGPRAGAAAPRLPRPPRHPPRRRGEGRPAGARHGILHRARPHRWAGAADLHRRANAWFQFGGHLETADPSVWAAARREAREESGIDTLEPPRRPVQLDRHGSSGAFGACREHLDLRYAAMAPDGARSRVSAESHDVRWWPVDALPEGTRRRARPAGVTRAGRLRSRLTRRRTGSCVLVPRRARGPRRWASPSRIAPGPLQAGVRREQPPEPGPWAGHEQVGELVEQHVVEHVVGTSRSRSETRMVPSAGVHEAHRRPIVDTQRTLVGRAWPPR